VRFVEVKQGMLLKFQRQDNNPYYCIVLSDENHIYHKRPQATANSKKRRRLRERWFQVAWVLRQEQLYIKHDRASVLRRSDMGNHVTEVTDEKFKKKLVMQYAAANL
jgi:hypothetical protein